VKLLLVCSAAAAAAAAAAAQTEIIDETDKFMDNEQTREVDISQLMVRAFETGHSVWRGRQHAVAIASCT
jgi:hypothetical protein